MTVPCFIINLEGSTQRFAHSERVLRDCGLDPVRLEAVDGRVMDINSISAYDRQRAVRYMGRTISPGEIGCYLSHIRFLETFLDTDAKMGLVFEDDINPGTDPAGQLDEIMGFLEGRHDWHVMHLGAHRLKFTSTFGGNAPPTILRAHYFPMLTHALLWNRAGAEAYLKAAAEIFCPADNMMRYVFTRSDMGLATTRPLFEAGAFESEISALSGGNRARQGRNWLYGWRKQRRLMVDKVLAARHRMGRSAG